METKKSSKKRIGVIITILSLLSIVLLFEYVKLNQWTNILLALEIISIITFLISFIFTYLKTGLWKFTHKPIKELDEREIALTNKSLRNAYAIFTIIVLFIMVTFAVAEKPTNMVLAVSLIVFAHILPASVIAWGNK